MLENWEIVIDNYQYKKYNIGKSKENFSWGNNEKKNSKNFIINKKKLRRLFIGGILIFNILNTIITSAKGVDKPISVPEEEFAAMDNIIKTYIDEILQEDYTWVSSDIKIYYNDKINGDEKIKDL